MYPPTRLPEELVLVMVTVMEQVVLKAAMVALLTTTAFLKVPILVVCRSDQAAKVELKGQLGLSRLPSM